MKGFDIPITYMNQIFDEMETNQSILGKDAFSFIKTLIFFKILMRWKRINPFLGKDAFSFIKTLIFF